MFARLIGTVCVLATLASAVSAEFVEVEFISVNTLHWKGWVDTERDELVIFDWQSSDRSLVPELPVIAKAGTRGAELWPGFYETAPWDVPDDWDGTIGSDWGFGFEDTRSLWTEFGYPGWGMLVFQDAGTPGQVPMTYHDQFSFQNWPMPWFGNDNAINHRAHALIIDGQLQWDPRLVRTPGDANLDGLFDSDDMVQVFTAGFYETGEFAYWWEGDWNDDGRFDSSDMVAAFQTGIYEQQRAASLVPEPSAIALFSIGLLCMIRRRR